MGSGDKYSLKGLQEKPVIDNLFFENQDEKSLRKQKSERYEQDTKHRKLLVIWTMIIISVWLLLVFPVLVFCRHLSDVVLTTLLATTTVNVLGLAKIILGNLFPHHRSNRRKN